MKVMLVASTKSFLEQAIKTIAGWIADRAYYGVSDNAAGYGLVVIGQDCTDFVSRIASDYSAYVTDDEIKSLLDKGVVFEWTTCNGNYLSIAQDGDRMLVGAGGRRHGIPWPDAARDALKTARVIEYVTEAPEVPWYAVGVRPQISKGPWRRALEDAGAVKRTEMLWQPTATAEASYLPMPAWSEDQCREIVRSGGVILPRNVYRQLMR